MFNFKNSFFQNYKLLFVIVSGLAVLISIIYSFYLRWLCDDIFIGLRYVQNFLAGHGLVYNVGERVEGYSDFLWIMIISFFTWLKVDELFTIQALGILSSAGTLILFSIITYKITYPRKIFIVPFVALAIALNYDYNVWATSGLETAFFGFLLSASYYAYFFSSLSEKNRKIFSGLFLCLAMLTRPEAILIFAMSNFLLLFQHFRKRTRIKKIISDIFLFNFAVIIIYVPYFTWRYNYYGFIFPNTYYVKVTSFSVFDKGLYYIWLYFRIHFISILFIILPPVVLFRMLRKKSLVSDENPENTNWDPAIVTAFLFACTYLISFVVKVGGDFMYARFVIPVVPFMFIVIYYSILKIVDEKKLNLVFMTLICLSLIETKFRFDYFKSVDENGKKIVAACGDVADERDFYVNYSPIELKFKFGKTLHKEFDGIDVRLLIESGQACIGYYSNFGYCQELHGLTDTLIAHSQIKVRGRIGHEKKAFLKYLENKRIHFLFYGELDTKDTFRIATIDIPPNDVYMSIVTYSNDVMDKLKERFGSGIKFIDFPSYLDDYIADKLPNKSKVDLKKDYDNFYLYYFMHNDDMVREDQFLSKLKSN